MKARFFLLGAIIPFLLSACGGGSSTPPPPLKFTIGGSVSNLAGMGGGLQLQDNGTDTLLVNANGSFTFPTALASGTFFHVGVFKQPSSPAQTCAVTNGFDIVTANVTNVEVDCGHNEWTWMGGSNAINQKGIYGTQGTPLPGNIPGAREASQNWIDASGNLWLFGGVGIDSTGALSQLNDLWKYSSGEWTWVGGSNVVNQKGIYGTRGTPAAANIPGARGLSPRLGSMRREAFGSSAEAVTILSGRL